MLDLQLRRLDEAEGDGNEEEGDEASLCSQGEAVYSSADGNAHHLLWALQSLGAGDDVSALDLVQVQQEAAGNRRLVAGGCAVG